MKPEPEIDGEAVIDIVEATEGVAEMLAAARDGHTPLTREVERDVYPGLRDITEFKSLVIER